MGGFLKTTLCTSAGVSGIDFTSGRTTGTGTTSDDRTWLPVPPSPGEQRSYGGAREAVHDATQDVHGDQENHKREVQADRAQVEGRDHLPDRLERWVGGRVDDLETRRHQPGRTPAARQHHHPVDDEPCEEQHEEDEQDRREDVPEESHGPRSSKGTRGVPVRSCRQSQDSAAKPPSRIRALSSAVTSTSRGLSRNTLFVTRSMLPRSPNDRPAAKSTSRLASASSISVRFMITGLPSRKLSPIWRASLYVRGCSVVIR